MTGWMIFGALVIVVFLVGVLRSTRFLLRLLGALVIAGALYGLYLLVRHIVVHQIVR